MMTPKAQNTLRLKNIFQLKKAVSFVEVIVATLILTTALAGVLASFVSVRAYVAHSNKRLVSMNVGRSVLARLGGCVTEASWNNTSSALYAPPGGAWQNHAVSEVMTVSPMDGVTYSPTAYQVKRIENASGVELYREVMMNITYPD